MALQTARGLCRLDIDMYTALSPVIPLLGNNNECGTRTTIWTNVYIFVPCDDVCGDVYNPHSL